MDIIQHIPLIIIRAGKAELIGRTFRQYGRIGVAVDVQIEPGVVGSFDVLSLPASGKGRKIGKGIDL